jgi:hypothetical protein
MRFAMPFKKKQYTLCPSAQIFLSPRVHLLLASHGGRNKKKTRELPILNQATAGDVIAKKEKRFYENRSF